jgi:hypothetical protein
MLRMNAFKKLLTAGAVAGATSLVGGCEGSTCATVGHLVLVLERDVSPRGG